MCGIVGRVNFRSNSPVASSVIRGMCNLLAHRGPDDEGIYTQGAMGFGHRRLAVIDLTPAAHQPMMSDDGQLCITGALPILVIGLLKLPGPMMTHESNYFKMNDEKDPGIATIEFFLKVIPP